MNILIINILVLIAIIVVETIVIKEVKRIEKSATHAKYEAEMAKAEAEHAKYEAEQAKYEAKRAKFAAEQEREKYAKAKRAIQKRNLIKVKTADRIARETAEQEKIAAIAAKEVAEQEKCDAIEARKTAEKELEAMKVCMESMVTPITPSSKSTPEDIYKDIQKKEERVARAQKKFIEAEVERLNEKDFFFEKSLMASRWAFSRMKEIDVNGKKITSMELFFTQGFINFLKANNLGYAFKIVGKAGEMGISVKENTGRRIEFTCNTNEVYRMYQDIGSDQYTDWSKSSLIRIVVNIKRKNIAKLSDYPTIAQIVTDPLIFETIKDIVLVIAKRS